MFRLQFKILRKSHLLTPDVFQKYKTIPSCPHKRHFSTNHLKVPMSRKLSKLLNISNKQNQKWSTLNCYNNNDMKQLTKNVNVNNSKNVIHKISKFKNCKSKKSAALLKKLTKAICSKKSVIKKCGARSGKNLRECKHPKDSLLIKIELPKDDTNITKQSFSNPPYLTKIRSYNTLCAKYSKLQHILSKISRNNYKMRHCCNKSKDDDKLYRTKGRCRNSCSSKPKVNKKYYVMCKGKDGKISTSSDGNCFLKNPMEKSNFHSNHHSLRAAKMKKSNTSYNPDKRNRKKIINIIIEFSGADDHTKQKKTINIINDPNPNGIYGNFKERFNKKDLILNSSKQENYFALASKQKMEDICTLLDPTEITTNDNGIYSFVENDSRNNAAPSKINGDTINKTPNESRYNPKENMFSVDYRSNKNTNLTLQSDVKMNVNGLDAECKKMKMNLKDKKLHETGIIDLVEDQTNQNSSSVFTKYHKEIASLAAKIESNTKVSENIFETCGQNIQDTFHNENKHRNFDPVNFKPDPDINIKKFKFVANKCDDQSKDPNESDLLLNPYGKNEDITLLESSKRIQENMAKKYDHKKWLKFLHHKNNKVCSKKKYDTKEDTPKRNPELHWISFKNEAKKIGHSIASCGLNEIKCEGNRNSVMPSPGYSDTKANFKYNTNATENKNFSGLNNNNNEKCITENDLHCENENRYYKKSYESTLHETENNISGIIDKPAASENTSPSYLELKAEDTQKSAPNSCNDNVSYEFQTRNQNQFDSSGHKNINQGEFGFKKSEMENSNALKPSESYGFSYNCTEMETEYKRMNQGNQLKSESLDVENLCPSNTVNQNNNNTTTPLKNEILSSPVTVNESSNAIEVKTDSIINNLSPTMKIESENAMSVKGAYSVQNTPACFKTETNIQNTNSWNMNQSHANVNESQPLNRTQNLNMKENPIKSNVAENNLQSNNINSVQSTNGTEFVLNKTWSQINENTMQKSSTTAAETKEYNSTNSEIENKNQNIKESDKTGTNYYSANYRNPLCYSNEITETIIKNELPYLEMDNQNANNTKSEETSIQNKCAKTDAKSADSTNNNNYNKKINIEKINLDTISGKSNNIDTLYSEVKNVYTETKTSNIIETQIKSNEIENVIPLVPQVQADQMKNVQSDSNKFHAMLETNNRIESENINQSEINNTSLNSEKNQTINTLNTSETIQNTSTDLKENEFECMAFNKVAEHKNEKMKHYIKNVLLKKVKPEHRIFKVRPYVKQQYSYEEVTPQHLRTASATATTNTQINEVLPADKNEELNSIKGQKNSVDKHIKNKTNISSVTPNQIPSISKKEFSSDVKQAVQEFQEKVNKQQKNEVQLGDKLKPETVNNKNSIEPTNKEMLCKNNNETCVSSDINHNNAMVSSSKAPEHSETKTATTIKINPKKLGTISITENQTEFKGEIVSETNKSFICGSVNYENMMQQNCTNTNNYQQCSQNMSSTNYENMQSNNYSSAEVQKHQKNTMESNNQAKVNKQALLSALVKFNSLLSKEVTKAMEIDSGSINVTTELYSQLKTLRCLLTKDPSKEKDSQDIIKLVSENQIEYETIKTDLLNALIKFNNMKTDITKQETNNKTPPLNNKSDIYKSNLENDKVLNKPDYKSKSRKHKKVTKKVKYIVTKKFDKLAEKKFNSKMHRHKSKYNKDKTNNDNKLDTSKLSKCKSRTSIRKFNLKTFKSNQNINYNGTNVTNKQNYNNTNRLHTAPALFSNTLGGNNNNDEDNAGNTNNQQVHQKPEIYKVKPFRPEKDKNNVLSLVDKTPDVYKVPENHNKLLHSSNVENKNNTSNVLPLAKIETPNENNKVFSKRYNFFTFLKPNEKLKDKDKNVIQTPYAKKGMKTSFLGNNSDKTTSNNTTNKMEPFKPRRSKHKNRYPYNNKSKALPFIPVLHTKTKLNIGNNKKLPNPSNLAKSPNPTFISKVEDNNPTGDNSTNIYSGTETDNKSFPKVTTVSIQMDPYTPENDKIEAIKTNEDTIIIPMEVKANTENQIEAKKTDTVTQNTPLLNEPFQVNESEPQNKIEVIKSEQEDTKKSAPETAVNNHNNQMETRYKYPFSNEPYCIKEVQLTTTMDNVKIINDDDNNTSSEAKDKTDNSIESSYGFLYATGNNDKIGTSKSVQDPKKIFKIETKKVDKDKTGGIKKTAKDKTGVKKSVPDSKEKSILHTKISKATPQTPKTSKPDEVKKELKSSPIDNILKPIDKIDKIYIDNNKFDHVYTKNLNKKIENEEKKAEQDTSLTPKAEDKTQIESKKVEGKGTFDDLFPNPYQNENKTKIGSITSVIDKDKSSVDKQLPDKNETSPESAFSENKNKEEPNKSIYTIEIKMKSDEQTAKDSSTAPKPMGTQQTNNETAFETKKSENNAASQNYFYSAEANKSSTQQATDKPEPAKFGQDQFATETKVKNDQFKDTKSAPTTTQDSYYYNDPYETAKNQNKNFFEANKSETEYQTKQTDIFSNEPHKNIENQNKNEMETAKSTDTNSNITSPENKINNYQYQYPNSTNQETLNKNQIEAAKTEQTTTNKTSAESNVDSSQQGHTFGNIFTKYKYLFPNVPFTTKEPQQIAKPVEDNRNQISQENTQDNKNVQNYAFNTENKLETAKTEQESQTKTYYQEQESTTKYSPSEAKTSYQSPNYQIQNYSYPIQFYQPIDNPKQIITKTGLEEKIASYGTRANQFFTTKSRQEEKSAAFGTKANQFYQTFEHPNQSKFDSKAAQEKALYGTKANQFYQTIENQNQHKLVPTQSTQEEGLYGSKANKFYQTQIQNKFSANKPVQEEKASYGTKANLFYQNIEQKKHNNISVKKNRQEEKTQISNENNTASAAASYNFVSPFAEAQNKARQEGKAPYAPPGGPPGNQFYQSVEQQNQSRIEQERKTQIANQNNMTRPESYNIVNPPAEANNFEQDVKSNLPFKEENVEAGYIVNTNHQLKTGSYVPLDKFDRPAYLVSHTQSQKDTYDASKNENQTKEGIFKYFNDKSGASYSELDEYDRPTYHYVTPNDDYADSDYNIMQQQQNANKAAFIATTSTENMATTPADNMGKPYMVTTPTENKTYTDKTYSATTPSDNLDKPYQTTNQQNINKSGRNLSHYLEYLFENSDKADGSEMVTQNNPYKPVQESIPPKQTKMDKFDLPTYNSSHANDDYPDTDIPKIDTKSSVLIVQQNPVPAYRGHYTENMNNQNMNNPNMNQPNMSQPYINNTSTVKPNMNNPNINQPNMNQPYMNNTGTVNPNMNNPNIVNPNVVNPNIVNPNIVNPNMVNPNIVNPNMVNPNIVNPNIINPKMVDPNIVNPKMVNPNIVNPNIVNPKMTNQNMYSPNMNNPKVINQNLYIAGMNNQIKTEQSQSMYNPVPPNVTNKANPKENLTKRVISDKPNNKDLISFATKSKSDDNLDEFDRPSYNINNEIYKTKPNILRVESYELQKDDHGHYNLEMRYQYINPVDNTIIKVEKSESLHKAEKQKAAKAAENKKRQEALEYMNNPDNYTDRYDPPDIKPIMNPYKEAEKKTEADTLYPLPPKRKTIKLGRQYEKKNSDYGNEDTGINVFDPRSHDKIKTDKAHLSSLNKLRSETARAIINSHKKQDPSTKTTTINLPPTPPLKESPTDNPRLSDSKETDNKNDPGKKMASSKPILGNTNSSTSMFTSSNYSNQNLELVNKDNSNANNFNAIIAANLVNSHFKPSTDIVQNWAKDHKLKDIEKKILAPDKYRNSSNTNNIDDILRSSKFTTTNDLSAEPKTENINEYIFKNFTEEELRAKLAEIEKKSENIHEELNTKVDTTERESATPWPLKRNHSPGEIKTKETESEDKVMTVFRSANTEFITKSMFKPKAFVEYQYPKLQNQTNITPVSVFHSGPVPHMSKYSATSKPWTNKDNTTNATLIPMIQSAEPEPINFSIKKMEIAHETPKNETQTTLTVSAKNTNFKTPYHSGPPVYMNFKRSMSKQDDEDTGTNNTQNSNQVNNSDSKFHSTTAAFTFTVNENFELENDGINNLQLIGTEEILVDEKPQNQNLFVNSSDNIMDNASVELKVAPPESIVAPFYTPKFQTEMETQKESVKLDNLLNAIKVAETDSNTSNLESGIITTENTSHFASANYPIATSENTSHFASANYPKATSENTSHFASANYPKATSENTSHFASANYPNATSENTSHFASANYPKATSENMHLMHVSKNIQQIPISENKNSLNQITEPIQSEQINNPIENVTFEQIPKYKRTGILSLDPRRQAARAFKQNNHLMRSLMSKTYFNHAINRQEMDDADDVPEIHSNEAGTIGSTTPGPQSLEYSYDEFPSYIQRGEQNYEENETKQNDDTNTRYNSYDSSSQYGDILQLFHPRPTKTVVRRRKHRFESTSDVRFGSRDYPYFLTGHIHAPLDINKVPSNRKCYFSSISNKQLGTNDSKKKNPSATKITKLEKSNVINASIHKANSLNKLLNDQKFGSNPKLLDRIISSYAEICSDCEDNKFKINEEINRPENLLGKLVISITPKNKLKFKTSNHICLSKKQAVNFVCLPKKENKSNETAKILPQEKIFACNKYLLEKYTVLDSSAPKVATNETKSPPNEIKTNQYMHGKGSSIPNIFANVSKKEPSITKNITNPEQKPVAKIQATNHNNAASKYKLEKIPIQIKPENKICDKHVLTNTESHKDTNFMNNNKNFQENFPFSSANSIELKSGALDMNSINTSLNFEESLNKAMEEHFKFESANNTPPTSNECTPQTNEIKNENKTNTSSGQLKESIAFLTNTKQDLKTLPPSSKHLTETSAPSIVKRKEKTEPKNNEFTPSSEYAEENFANYPVKSDEETKANVSSIESIAYSALKCSEFKIQEESNETQNNASFSNSEQLDNSASKNCDEKSEYYECETNTQLPSPKTNNEKSEATKDSVNNLEKSTSDKDSEAANLSSISSSFKSDKDEALNLNMPSTNNALLLEENLACPSSAPNDKKDDPTKTKTPENFDVPTPLIKEDFTKKTPEDTILPVEYTQHKKSILNFLQCIDNYRGLNNVNNILTQNSKHAASIICSSRKPNMKSKVLSNEEKLSSGSSESQKTGVFNFSNHTKGKPNSKQETAQKYQAIKIIIPSEKINSIVVKCSMDAVAEDKQINTKKVTKQENKTKPDLDPAKPAIGFNNIISSVGKEVDASEKLMKNKDHSDIFIVKSDSTQSNQQNIDLKGICLPPTVSSELGSSSIIAKSVLDTKDNLDNLGKKSKSEKNIAISDVIVKEKTKPIPQITNEISPQDYYILSKAFDKAIDEPETLPKIYNSDLNNTNKMGMDVTLMPQDKNKQTTPKELKALSMVDAAKLLVSTKNISVATTDNSNKFPKELLSPNTNFANLSQSNIEVKGFDTANKKLNITKKIVASSTKEIGLKATPQIKEISKQTSNKKLKAISMLDAANKLFHSKELKSLSKQNNIKLPKEISQQKDKKIVLLQEHKDENVSKAFDRAMEELETLNKKHTNLSDIKTFGLEASSKSKESLKHINSKELKIPSKQGLPQIAKEDDFASKSFEKAKEELEELKLPSKQGLPQIAKEDDFASKSFENAKEELDSLNKTKDSILTDTKTDATPKSGETEDLSQIESDFASKAFEKAKQELDLLNKETCSNLSLIKEFGMEPALDSQETNKEPNVKELKAVSMQDAANQLLKEYELERKVSPKDIASLLLEKARNELEVLNVQSMLSSTKKEEKRLTNSHSNLELNNKGKKSSAKEKMKDSGLDKTVLALNNKTLGDKDSVKFTSVPPVKSTSVQDLINKEISSKMYDEEKSPDRERAEVLIKLFDKAIQAIETVNVNNILDVRIKKVPSKQDVKNKVIEQEPSICLAKGKKQDFEISMNSIEKTKDSLIAKSENIIREPDNKHKSLPPIARKKQPEKLKRLSTTKPKSADKSLVRPVSKEKSIKPETIISFTPGVLAKSSDKTNKKDDKKPAQKKDTTDTSAKNKPQAKKVNSLAGPGVAAKSSGKKDDKASPKKEKSDSSAKNKPPGKKIDSPVGISKASQKVVDKVMKKEENQPLKDVKLQDTPALRKSMENFEKRVIDTVVKSTTPEDPKTKPKPKSNAKPDSKKEKPETPKDNKVKATSNKVNKVVEQNNPVTLSLSNSNSTLKPAIIVKNPTMQKNLDEINTAIANAKSDSTSANLVIPEKPNQLVVKKTQLNENMPRDAPEKAVIIEFTDLKEGKLFVKTKKNVETDVEKSILKGTKMNEITPKVTTKTDFRPVQKIENPYKSKKIIVKTSLSNETLKLKDNDKTVQEVRDTFTSSKPLKSGNKPEDSTKIKVLEVKPVDNDKFGSKFTKFIMPVNTIAACESNAQYLDIEVAEPEDTSLELTPEKTKEETVAKVIKLKADFEILEQLVKNKLQPDKLKTVDPKNKKSASIQKKAISIAVEKMRSKNIIPKNKKNPPAKCISKYEIFNPTIYRKVKPDSLSTINKKHVKSSKSMKSFKFSSSQCATPETIYGSVKRIRPTSTSSKIGADVIRNSIVREISRNGIIKFQKFMDIEHTVEEKISDSKPAPESFPSGAENSVLSNDDLRFTTILTEESMHEFPKQEEREEEAVAEEETKTAEENVQCAAVAEAEEAVVVELPAEDKEFLDFRKSCSRYNWFINLAPSECVKEKDRSYVFITKFEDED